MRLPIEGTDNQRAVFHQTLRELAGRNISFGVGGSLAIAYYLSRVSPIRDLDVYVTPENSALAIDAVTAIGLADYYDQKPYQRHWIYRASRGDAIVDVIWAMANARTEVDPDWLCRAHPAAIDDENARIIPIEELIWSKLYVLQFDRCDWPEIINLVLAVPERIDWDRLMLRLGPDTPLLIAVLTIALWIDPEIETTFSQALRDRLRIDPQPKPDRNTRANLLDMRPWLSQPEGNG